MLSVVKPTLFNVNTCQKDNAKCLQKQTELSSRFVSNFLRAISSLHSNNLGNYNKILITVKAGQAFPSLMN